MSIDLSLVENSNFVLDEIPEFHPIVQKYDRTEFWKREKRRSVEGYWISGIWMPGPLYYYVNFHKILFEDESSVSQTIGLPWLRDIDWELFLYYEECRGFSGFSEDTAVTCDRKYGPEKELALKLGRITHEEILAKKYIPAREYLRLNHGKNLGKPLYKNSAKHFCSIQSRGGGKETPEYQKVMTPDGYKLMGDLNIGDYVISEKGNPIKVIGTYPQGKKEIWEVHLQDGRIIECGAEHLWSVKSRGKKKYKTLTTKELYNLYKPYSNVKRKGRVYDYYIPKNPTVPHTTKRLPIHPYIVGALLGDGTMTTQTPKIASSDKEIIDRFKKLLPDYEIVHDKSTTNNYTLKYVGDDKYSNDYVNGKYGINPLFRELKKLKLNVKGTNKYIPDIYKYGSIEQRLELVRGLMDTDGSCTKKGQCEFTNTSLQLVKDLATVCRSLGIRCYIGKEDNRIGKINHINNSSKKPFTTNKISYRLHISPDNKYIFHLTRKKERQILKTLFEDIAIDKIVKTNKYTKQKCIMVDSPTNLYLTEDYVVTHNTYSTSGIVNHNWIFDGATDYDIYLENKKKKTPTASDTIVGAIDTKYSSNLVDKCKTAMTYYPGEYRVSDDLLYRSPLMPQYSGSLAPNREYKSITQSLLRHRTFKDNPLAANGTRPNVCALDEIGFMNNIKEAWSAIEATQQSKQKKNLVIWALGTGGLVSGAAALYAESVFRNPEQHNCISFDDEYENRGKIGYFVPYTKTLNEFKEGPNLITNEAKASIYVQDKRDVAKKGDITTYYGEIINGPIVPSEAFLVVDGAYFPTLLLKEQLKSVEGGEHFKYTEASFKGNVIFDEEDKPDFITVQDAMPIREFPLSKDRLKTGCVEIWVKPQRDPISGVVPFNLHIGGMDVVDKDLSTTSSLPSIFIMNRLTRQIVAEYTGRTENSKDFFEICRRLLMYYNATGMYEQNLPGMFTYFEQKRSLHLLADTPYQLRNADTFRVGTNTSKGINASTKVNSTGRQFVKSWLLEKLSVNSDERILNTIYSSAALKELISWNADGNFDRVSALGMLLWHDETMYREEKKKQEIKQSFLDSDYFVEMGLKKKSNKFAKPDDNNYLYKL